MSTSNDADNQELSMKSKALFVAAVCICLWSVATFGQAPAQEPGQGRVIGATVQTVGTAVAKKN